VRSTLPLWAWLAILALSSVLNVVDIGHGVDGRSRELWREADVAGIARNFVREGMRISYPRIDWRGDGPGYVEMEFPIYPYLIAVGYKVFGIHEIIGRLITYAVALLTLCVFLRLASFLLPPPGAAVAGIFYALNPLVVRLGNTIQPEPFMLLGYVAATYAFIRWLDDGRWQWYVSALLLTTFAILAKAPAAHIGVVFLLFTLWRRGGRAWRDPRLWAFAVLALLPPVLWYAHARNFWVVYGNSLGVSNHHHFAGLAPFVDPQYIRGIAHLELTYVWTKAGALAVALALLLGPLDAAAGYALLWYLAVGIYYIVIAGTSADTWATYYHVVSVPAAALLMGVAAVVFLTRVSVLDRMTWLRLALTGTVLVAGVGLVLWMAPAAGRFALAGLVVIGLAVLARARFRARIARWPHAQLVSIPPGQQRLALATLAASGLGAVALAARETVHELHPAYYVEQYATAQQFARLMRPGTRIISSGNLCVTPSESAYEQPWYFYWTDHKGFSPCVQDLSLALTDQLRQRGAAYFILENFARVRRPDFVADMRRTYPVLDDTPQATLFELQPLAVRN
jgi:4-amino-4-deoxy-L-arabinose transferase-like glycosyltransferase